MQFLEKRECGVLRWPRQPTMKLYWNLSIFVAMLKAKWNRCMCNIKKIYMLWSGMDGRKKKDPRWLLWHITHCCKHWNFRKWGNLVFRSSRYSTKYNAVVDYRMSIDHDKNQGECNIMSMTIKLVIKRHQRPCRTAFGLAQWGKKQNLLVTVQSQPSTNNQQIQGGLTTTLVTK